MAEAHHNATFVVTGGNRGIGFALVAALLARPNTTVVATVRNQATISQLEADAANVDLGQNSQLKIMVIDLITTSHPDLVREAFDAAVGSSVKHIDVLVSNAGAVTSMGTALNTGAEDLQHHFQVNSIAPLMIFQAFWPLMQKSQQPKFVAVSSSGPSKAALNWLVKRLHNELEKEGLTIIAVHPGWVQTEMGQFAADAWSYPEAPPLTVQQSVAGIISVIDQAARDTTSGKFISYDGTMLAW